MELEKTLFRVHERFMTNNHTLPVVKICHKITLSMGKRNIRYFKLYFKIFNSEN